MRHYFDWNQFFQILILLQTYVRSDKTCDSIGVDAITILFNNTFIIFQKSDVWLWNKETRDMTGPCPVKAMTGEVEGPVDAAVTIVDHSSIVEFIGATLLFQKKEFFTFKNLKPYVVEWGSLQYIPHKGLQQMMGASSEKAQKIIEKSKVMAAYYDPTDSTTKLVFTDLSILGFTFQFGIEFESPLISDLSTELKSFGVDLPQLPVTAAVSLKSNKDYRMYIFSNEKYCSFAMKKGSDKQICDFKPNSQFFVCKEIRVNKNCVTSDNSENPIEVSVNPIDNNSGQSGDLKKVENRNLGVSSRSDSGSDGKQDSKSEKDVSKSLNGKYSLCFDLHLLIFTILLPFIAFNFTNF